MKKLLFVLFLLSLCSGLGYSATKQPQNLGSVNFNGIIVDTPTFQSNVSTTTPIAITGSWMVVESTGGLVTFPITSSFPAISTSTAINGQYLIVSATTSISTISISTGTNSAVIGGDQFILISSTKNPVGFIYDGTLSQWRELGRQ